MNVYDHIRAAALAHDIGHPPYGHGGESALNYMMQNDKDCGFEGNAQNLRILSPLNPLENMFNLTRRTLLAVIKYPVTYSRIKSYKSVKNNQCECKNRLIKPSKYKPPKCIYDNYQGTLNNLLSGFSEDDSVLFQEIYLDKSQKKSKFKTFDCSIIELADDIAYSTHDLEDAIMLGIVDWEQCCDTLSSDKAEVKYIDKKLRKIDNNYSIKNMFKKDHTAKKIFGRLINILIQDISFVITTKKFHDPLLKYNVAFIHHEVSKFIGLLQEIVKEKVINSVESKTYERGGLILIMRLFETINADPKSLLPKEEQDKYIQNAQNTHQQRVVCDYIAGMTDEYAFKLHKRLFGYDPGSFFEKLSF